MVDIEDKISCHPTVFMVFWPKWGSWGPEVMYIDQGLTVAEGCAASRPSVSRAFAPHHSWLPPNVGWQITQEESKWWSLGVMERVWLQVSTLEQLSSEFNLMVLLHLFLFSSFGRRLGTCVVCGSDYIFLVPGSLPFYLH